MLTATQAHLAEREADAQRLAAVQKEGQTVLARALLAQREAEAKAAALEEAKKRMEVRHGPLCVCMCVFKCVCVSVSVSVCLCCVCVVIQRVQVEVARAHADHERRALSPPPRAPAPGAASLSEAEAESLRRQAEERKREVVRLSEQVSDLHAELFHLLAIHAKSAAAAAGKSNNVSIAQLYDKAQKARVPRAEWGAWLKTQLRSQS